MTPRMVDEKYGTPPSGALQHPPATRILKLTAGGKQSVFGHNYPMDRAISPSFTLQRISLEGFNPGEMIHAVQGGTLEHTQLTPGRFKGDLLHVHAGRFSVDWGRYNLPVLGEGTFCPDAVTLGFVFNDSGHAIFNGKSVAPSSMLLFSEGHELVTSLPRACSWVSVQAGRGTLASLGLEIPEDCFSVVRLDGEATKCLGRSLVSALRYLDTACRDGARGDTGDVARALVDIEDAAVAALATMSNSYAPLAVKSRRRNVRQAYLLARNAADYMDAHLSHPITIADVCAANRCTYKALGRAFLDVYGIAPKGYLTKKRLSKLRSLLLNAASKERNLADMYLSCGLTHFGRASRAYMSLFREVPSTTVLRRIIA